MDYIGPMFYTGLRFALGALIILPMALRPDRDTSPRRITGYHALAGGIAAGIVLFLASAIQQVGLIYTTAGKAGFITGLYVVIVPLLGLLLGQKISINIWVGAVLAIIGLYLLSVTETFSMTYGDSLQVFSALFWALHVLIVGALARRTHATRLACVQFTVCAGLGLIAAPLFSEDMSMNVVVAATVPILYGGAVSVGLGYTLQVIAQRDAIASHAAIILSMEAVVAVLAGWILLDETLSGRGVLGCALMLSGMLMTQLALLWRRKQIG